MKKCSKCQQTKSTSEFNKNRSKKDGYATECKECSVENYRKWRKNNPEKLRELRKEHDKKYYENNKDRKREWNTAYKKQRRRTDPIFRLMDNVRTQVGQILKREGTSKKGESALQYLPWTKEELEQHLVSQFTEGMTLDNYGEWHLDHIYPQSKLLYDSMDHPNFQKCWALENLQPLWAEDNIIKHNKIL